ncbi:ankyrin repeat-containing domain protein [Colletotrichum cereale]|nr:ankyrin repeat-containing domain protein [Colletotrichum cereale]
MSRRTTQNLWDEAYSLLADDLRSKLESVQVPQVDLLRVVLDEAHRKKEACVRTSWKLKKPGGGEIIILEVLEKIIKWIDCFKAVGDTAVQYNPLDAALPWAVVRFLLQTAVNGFGIFGAVLENLEVVSRLISRHAISEDLYLRHATSTGGELRKALTRLYAGILAHLATTIRYLEASSWDFAIDEIVARDADVDKFVQMLIAELTINNVGTTSGMLLLLKQLEAPIANLFQQHLDLRLEPEKGPERCEFLNWLSSLAYQDQHREVSTVRLKHSGNWIMEHQKMKVECLSLIDGVLATGSAFVVIDALDEVDDTERVKLIGPLISIVRNAQNSVKVILTSRDNEQILSLLREAPKLAIRPQETRQDMALFIRHKIQRRKEECIGVLGGNLSAEFENKLFECLQKRAAEMFLLVELQLERLAFIETEDDALAALDSVPPGLSATYQTIMAKIASSGERAQDLAKRTFQWLLHAKEPLSIGALLCAIDTNTATGFVNINQSALLRICRNLITVDPFSSKVRFSHATIQEFLLLETDFTASKSNQTIASTCLEISTNGLIQNGESLAKLNRYCVLHWPHHYGNAGSEVNQVLSAQLHSFIFDKSLSVSSSFELWLEDAFNYSRELPVDNVLRKHFLSSLSDSCTPLFAACVFNLRELPQHCDVPGFDWNQLNQLGCTPLYLAARLGNVDIVVYLLSKRVDVNKICGHFGTALYAACFHGHGEIVSKLVEYGADPRVHTAPFSSAVEAIVRGGHEAIATWLVQRELHSLTQNQRDLTMRQAAHAGFVEVVDILMEFQPKPDQRRAERLIADAVNRGHVLQLQRLLKKDPGNQALIPPDAVATAALQGHLPMLDFCHGLGHSIEVEGHFGTPLRAASLKGQKAVVEKLIELGADLSDGKGLEAASMKGHLPIVKTIIRHIDENPHLSFNLDEAIHVAASHGRLDVVEYLVKVGSGNLQVDTLKRVSDSALRFGHDQVYLFAIGIRKVEECDGDHLWFPTDPTQGQ